MKKSTEIKAVDIREGLLVFPADRFVKVSWEQLVVDEANGLVDAIVWSGDGGKNAIYQMKK